MSARNSFVYQINDNAIPTNPSSSTSPTANEIDPNDVHESIHDESIDLVVDTTNQDSTTPVPDWYNLNMIDIYDKLNPFTKEGKVYQRGWRKHVVDCNGKAILSIGLVANRLLKYLIKKKLIPNIELNCKLQQKKVNRLQQQKYFIKLSNNPVHISLVRKFISEHIRLPGNDDDDDDDDDNNGGINMVTSLGSNVGTKLIILAVDSEKLAGYENGTVVDKVIMNLVSNNKEEQDNRNKLLITEENYKRKKQQNEYNQEKRKSHMRKVEQCKELLLSTDYNMVSNEKRVKIEAKMNNLIDDFLNDKL